MNKFCKECGKEVSEEHSHCKHCGTPANEKEVEKENIVKKQPMTKKNKVLLSSVVSAIIILVSLHMWANAHFSQESVEKRFDAAMEENNAKKLAKLVVHEDGSSISEHEAKAFLELVQAGGNMYVDGLTYVVFDGKFLGMYDSYKIEVINQFVTYDNFVEGLSFEFNDEAFPIYERDEEYITYGPLAPGEYTIEATFDGDLGEKTFNDSLTVDSSYSEPIWIDMDIPISMVSFYVENYYQFDTVDAYIIFNDEKYEIIDDGETEEIGPVMIDGSQHINIAVDMPWGEVVSEDISMNDSIMFVYADLITNEQYKEVTKVLTDFGDGYLNALANQTTKPLTMTTERFKDDITFNFGEDLYYTGQFQELQVDKHSITINLESENPEINIDARYLIKEDIHSLSNPPELYEDEYMWNIHVMFNEKEWLIDSFMYTDMWMEDLDILAGSKTLYGPSEETIQTAQTNRLEEEIEDFIIQYTIASVDAINERYFDTVGYYITEEGPRREEAREYIDYLDSKDIYEEWHGTELESLEEIDGHTWKVTVIEEFDIIKPDNSDVKSFRTVLVVKKIDDNYYVDELLETNEI